MTGYPRNVLLRGIVGSTAYGLAGPDSDVDRIGVFLADTDSFLGLDAPTETWTSPEGEGDQTLHELGKAVRLLLKVNPTVTEILWLPDELYEVRSSIGQELLERRQLFLSAAYVKNAYLGYATGQFGKLEARGDGSFSSTLRKRTAKHARHLARLLHQGFGLWERGELVVRLEAPQWYLDFGNRVAGIDPSAPEDQQPEPDLDAAKAMLHQWEELFRDTPTRLPAEPRREEVDWWLKSVRRRLL